MNDSTGFPRFTFDDQDLTFRIPSLRDNEYFIDEGLYYAVKTAFFLKQPLLLTGKPGTGKTELANKLAADLHKAYPAVWLPFPLVFVTKTTSAATDLFYSYDALGHFNAARFETRVPASNFIQLQAFGQAILLSNPGVRIAYKPMYEVADLPNLLGQTRSSVVLIDEVDKAPRDFTNDLLTELERMRFTVREDENRPYKIGDGQVFVVLTSNSERSLPEAFLRRCVFYHIEFPQASLLRQILLSRLFSAEEAGTSTIQELVSSYLDIFQRIRAMQLNNPPATAELISWMFYLRPHIYAHKKFMDLSKEIRTASFSILVKDTVDLASLKSSF